MKFVIPQDISSHFGAEQNLGDGLKGCPVVKNLPFPTFKQLRDVDNMLVNVRGTWFYVTDDPAVDAAPEEGCDCDGDCANCDEPTESDQDSQELMAQEASEADLAEILKDPFLCGGGNR